MEVVTLTARNKEMIARSLLLDPSKIAHALHSKQWQEIIVLLEYIQGGIPIALSKTDPALFRNLCAGLAEFHILGYGSLNLERIRKLAKN